jgi:hypothetical protein
VREFTLSVWAKNHRAPGGYHLVYRFNWREGVDSYDAAKRLAGYLCLEDWESTYANKGRPSYIIRNEGPEA